MVDYWAEEAAPARSSTVPVVVINDRDEPWEGPVRLRLVAGEKTLLRIRAMPGSAGWQRDGRVRCIPRRAARPLPLIAAITLDGEEIESVREFQVFSPAERRRERGPRQAGEGLVEPCPGRATGRGGGRWRPGERAIGSSDPQWLAIDLGAEQQISRWSWSGRRLCDAYKIQVSANGMTWKDVFTTNRGTGGQEVVRFAPVTARWVRMYAPAADCPRLLAAGDQRFRVAVVWTRFDRIVLEGMQSDDERRISARAPAYRLGRRLPRPRRGIPGDVMRQTRRDPPRLPAAAPEAGEPFDAILRDFEEIILPGITHWQSPNFFGFFPSNNSGPSILGELLSAGLGVQGMLWATSPACTELETHVLDWLVDLLGLPKGFQLDTAGGGVIQDSASSATLCAILAARERATAGRSNLSGADGSLVAYTSTQAHSSVEKGVRIAGLGSENLRLIEVDEQYAMRPDRLAEAIAADRAAGRRPCFRGGDGWHHVVDGHRSDCRESAGSAASTDSGSTSTRRWPARPRFAPSSTTSTTASSWPTATASIRTSGCLRTSIATASSSPTGRH